MCTCACEHAHEAQDGVDPAGARRMYTVLCCKDEVRTAGSTAGTVVATSGMPWQQQARRGQAYCGCRDAHTFTSARMRVASLISGRREKLRRVCVHIEEVRAQ